MTFVDVLDSDVIAQVGEFAASFAAGGLALSAIPGVVGYAVHFIIRLVLEA